LFSPEHAHIFVGDLSQEVDSEMLREAFAKFGEVSSVFPSSRSIAI
jgi:hypothetical protein